MGGRRQERTYGKKEESRERQERKGTEWGEEERKRGLNGEGTESGLGKRRDKEDRRGEEG